ncbi:MAG TPA: hypothetical protein VF167_09515, partial [Longimicrobiaceae bacterium]
VWGLIAAACDWRWGLYAADGVTITRHSPWYRSLTLYRQPRAGAWPETVDTIVHDLTRWRDGHQSRRHG